MYRETCNFVCEQKKVVFTLWQTVQVSSVGFRVTPSLILRPPSFSAPACDSEWSLHKKKKETIILSQESLTVRIHEEELRM